MSCDGMLMPAFPTWHDSRYFIFYSPGCLNEGYSVTVLSAFVIAVMMFAHAAHDADGDLVAQAERFQTGRAQHQLDALAVKRAAVQPNSGEPVTQHSVERHSV